MSDKPASTETMARPRASARASGAAPAEDAALRTAEAAANAAVGRFNDQIAAALKAGEEAAQKAIATVARSGEASVKATEEAARRAEARIREAEAAVGTIADRLKTAEKAADAAVDRVTEKVFASVKAADDAAARLPEQLAARLEAAEEALRQASERASRLIAARIAAAEAEAGRIADRMAEDLRATEEAGRQLVAAQTDAMQGAENAGAAVFDGFARAQREVVDFVTGRIRQDIETQAELLGCRTLDDMREVQTRFFRTAMDEYASEASRLMRIGSEVATRSLDRGRS